MSDSYGSRGPPSPADDAFDRAIAAIHERARMNESHDIRERPYAALMYDELEEYDEAIEKLTVHIEAGGPCGAAYNNRAVALWEIGRTAEALEDFDRAIAALPNSSLPATSKAELLRKSGRIEEAVAAIDLALTTAPRDAVVRRVRAGMLVELGRLADALADLNEAVRLEPLFEPTIRRRDELAARLGL